jgi:hypothetical protein
VTCEEADACDTTGLAATSGDWTPTTSDGVQTVTGDSPDPDASSGSTAPAEETGDEPGGTTDEPVLPPQIVDGVVIPDYIDDNGLLSVEVTRQHRGRDDAARRRRADRADADPPGPVPRAHSSIYRPRQ